MAAEPTLCTKTFKLNNGLDFPAVGLGTFQGQPGTKEEDLLVESIVHALRSGYRLIDTAQSYGVEALVGRAVRASGVPRAEITVMTKFWNDLHHDPAEALRISLANLGLDYVDVLLMHFPCAMSSDGKRTHLRPDQSPTYVETWRAMEGLVGPRCRSIGVSNFTQKTLGTLLETAAVVPAINQIECHALNPCLKLVPYCQSKGIHVVGWRTIGGIGAHNEVLTHGVFAGIAQAHGCSTAVVSLSWSVQRGISVIPKSSSKARIEENIRLVTLTEAEMAAMNDAHETVGRLRIPDELTVWHGQAADGTRTFMNWTAVDFGWEDEQGNWLT